MATQNSTNTKVTNNADGFDLAGGTTPRKITVTSGDVTVTGGGSAVITFPSVTSQVLGTVLVATLASDATTGANTTPIDLTGLVWTYVSGGIYYIRYIGAVNAAANTTGCGFSLNVSSAITDVNMTQFHQLANAGTITGGSSIADDTVLGVSSGIPTNSTNVPVAGFGILSVGANTGTAQLRFASETTAAISAKAGFTLIVEKIA